MPHQLQGSLKRIWTEESPLNEHSPPQPGLLDPPAVCPGELTFLHMSLHSSLAHMKDKSSNIFSRFFFFFPSDLPGLSRMEIRDCILPIHLPQSEGAPEFLLCQLQEAKRQEYLFVSPSSTINNNSFDLDKNYPTDGEQSWRNGEVELGRACEISCFSQRLKPQTVGESCPQKLFYL